MDIFLVNQFTFSRFYPKTSRSYVKVLPAGKPDSNVCQKNYVKHCCNRCSKIFCEYKKRLWERENGKTRRNKRSKKHFKKYCAKRTEIMIGNMNASCCLCSSNNIEKINGMEYETEYICNRFGKISLIICYTIYFSI